MWSNITPDMDWKWKKGRIVLYLIDFVEFITDNFRGVCCNFAIAQINYPRFKHNTQDSIEQARGRFHEEGSSQIFMLDDMQFGGGGLDVI